MSEHSRNTINQLPPMEITYLDGSVFMTDRTAPLEAAEKNYNIATQALKLGAHVVNAYPVYVGGQERVAMLKLEAAAQGIQMGYTKSTGEYGIME